MAKLYFICGSTGAGKSTYAKSLIQSQGGVHFSIDEFMKNLFWMDVPSEGQLPWAEERVARCESLIMALAVQTFQQGLNVILDLGFSTLEQRKKFYDWSKQKGLPFELHYLDVPLQERWRRVKERNRQLDAQSIPVDRATFDWMENYFQAPQDLELQEHSGKRIT